MAHLRQSGFFFDNIEESIAFSHLLGKIRAFLTENSLLEIETPLLIPSPNPEAFIDSLKVTRHEISKQPHLKTKNKNECYLISSPEFYLKSVLCDIHSSLSIRGIFQIAHCFRSGEIGKHHREEFIMLELYLLDKNEHELMDFFSKCLNTLAVDFNKSLHIHRKRLSDVFAKYCGKSWQQLRKYEKTFLSFEEQFHRQILEKVEPHLGQSQPEYIYDYPGELSGYSKVVPQQPSEYTYSRRFELYWKGMELANGYYELTTYEEYIQRMQSENQLRSLMKKKNISLQHPFIQKLRNHGPLPKCSGIAVGLDRLFMLLRDRYEL